MDLPCPSTKFTKEKQFRVRPKPGNIHFSFSLVVVRRHNRNLASRVASPHGSRTSVRFRRAPAPVLCVGRRLDHRAQQLSRDADVLQRHCSAGSPRWLRLSIARASSGQAPSKSSADQLQLRIWLGSVRHGQVIFSHHRAFVSSDELTCFSRPRCYLSWLLDAEACSTVGYQLRLDPVVSITRYSRYSMGMSSKWQLLDEFE